jgi:hypothetical protein
LTLCREWPGRRSKTRDELVWLDSAGPITDGVRALAEKIAPVDIAIIGYQGHPVAQVQVPVTLEIVKLFKPRTYMPAHHDQIFGTFVDLGIRHAGSLAEERRSLERGRSRRATPRQDF